MNQITADNLTLMNQASMTATEYMDAGIKAIDARFGNGYARANPTLLGAFINAAASDYGASIAGKALWDGVEAIRNVAVAIVASREL